MTRGVAWLCVLLTIALTVYGQFVLKWQVNLAGELPAGTGPRVHYVWRLLLNPWVISAFAAAFAASLCWMAAIGRLPLSKAYPFTALSFPLVAIISTWLFRETLDWHKIAGTALIIAGVIVVSRSGMH